MTNNQTDTAPAGPWHELGLDLVVDRPQVRSWVEYLPIGATRPFHTHRAPWLTVVVSGGRAMVLRSDGAGEELELRTGEVKFNPLADGEPVRHALRNIGDTDLTLVAVQLDAEAGPTP